MSAAHPGGHRARHRRKALAALCACMALACSNIAAPGPESPPIPAEPRQGPLTGLLDDLGRIVGRETVDRGDELLGMFRERGLDPEVHEFPATASERQPRVTGKNLIATVGEGPRDIVVGAHYDVARLQDGTVVGGAVDNGAASVVLTRVAESLKRHELSHRVRVVLFDLEEAGLLGSQAYVQAEDTARVAAMVNVDVVVGDETLMYGPTSHEGNDTVYRSLRVACATSELTCMGFPRYPPSDDRPFQAAGIPNVSVAVNDAAASHQMWLALNLGAQSGLREGFVPEVFRIIHSSRDTIEHVSEAAMNHLHDLVVALVLELDRSL
ncbi:MAG: M28 family peptidase [Acidobacteriota bacterium]|nr:M28 family peptidase [Acidobacteriota bacterium]